MKLNHSYRFVRQVTSLTTDRNPIIRYLTDGSGIHIYIVKTRQVPRDQAVNDKRKLNPNQRRNMPSEAHILTLAVGMLATSMLCATGAPLTETPTALPSGDPTGVEETFEPISSAPVWNSVIRAAKQHQEAFEGEFQNNVLYHVLENYKVASLPAKCPSFNFSKEACLHRLAHGLYFYTSLLKHVEKDYPRSVILTEAKHNTRLILRFIRQKMKKPEQVTSLSSREEESLLSTLDNSDTFHSKMTAHSILRQLYIFLVDGKRALARKERRRGRHGGMSMLV
nr:interleukin 6 [Oostethus manadensis]